MAKIYLGLIDGRDIAVSDNTLSGCRRKCVAYLKKNKSIKSLEVWKEPTDDGYEGEVYLNRKGKGVFQIPGIIGSILWMIEKNGRLGKKVTDGMREF